MWCAERHTWPCLQLKRREFSMFDDPDLEQPDCDQAAISERKRAANRRNAEQSTGPRTKKGRTKSRFNALKHGMAAKSLAILGPESVKVFKRLLKRLRKETSPKGFDEERLVEDKALVYTRLGWCARADAAAFAVATKEERDRQEDDGNLHDEDTDDAEDDAGPDYFSFPAAGHMRKRARYERELHGRLQLVTRQLEKLQKARKAREAEEDE
jgi:hypothetical protein